MARAGPADLRRRFERSAPEWLDQARSEIQKRYGRIWGMDLGTSKSAVALFDLEARAPVVCPHDGKSHFPSTLCIDKRGNEVIGLDALEQLRPDLRGCIEGSKRAMGTRRVYQIGDRRFSPEEVAARFMSHGRGLVEGFLRNQVEDRVLDLAKKALGAAVPRQWIEEEPWSKKTTFSAAEAIVTIPAYFNFDQRRATRDAAEVAGIKVRRLVSEPTAACLSAGLTRKRTGNILVVDLGAGTLDVSHIAAHSIETGETLFEVERVFGDGQFGSRDFDVAIEQEFMAQLKQSGATELSGLDKRRLRAATEQVKIALSSSNHASYDLVSFAGRSHHTLELGAARLEALLSSQLDRLTNVCREAIDLPIDHLILVGGPMFSPIVRQRIEGVLRRKADAVVDPRTAVAMGAAWQGAVISDHDRVPLLLLDIVPFALGVLVKNGPQSKPAVSFHIPQGTRIPHQDRKPYTTTEDNQPAVAVQVFQGLGDSTEPSANSRLALFTLEGLPPAKAGEPKIDVIFDIDANGLLEVTAKDERTGRSKSLRVDDTIWLSPSERTDMTGRLAKSRQWASERSALTKLAQTGAALVERLGSLERQQPATTWQSQFATWRGLQNPAFDTLAPAEQSMLAEMYNHGQTSCDRFVLELDRARNLVLRCRRFIDAVREVNLFGVETEIEKQLHGLRELGEQVTQQTHDVLTSLDELAARFQRWNATMAHCATLFGDPRDRLIACHNASSWQEASEAFEKAFAAEPVANVPPSAIARHLDGLARLNRREEYRRAIGRYGECLFLQNLDFDRLNEFGRYARPAMAWVFVHGKATGSGFLAGKNLVVTNLHVVCDTAGPVAAKALTVELGGVPNPVVRMKLPSRPGVDLVVLELSRLPDVRPMRVGYGSLVEVGERVLAIGFPLPEGKSFEENILLDHGIVNRIRTRTETGSREFELGLRIFSGMSGGPVFNDRGEVIGISTFVRYQTAGPQGPIVDKSSHAIAADPLHELLPPPWCPGER